jgi:hypothetical protein
METYWLTLVPKQSGTRLLLTRGQDEVLRAVLPPLPQIHHEQGVTKLLEGLSLWLGCRLYVALSAAEPEHSFRLNLTDELGAGARSVFYAVEPVATGARRGRRIRGVTDPGFDEARQLWLWAATGGMP